MPLPAYIALSLALAWAMVLLFWFPLQLPNRPRTIALLAVLPVLYSLPLLVPASYLAWRVIPAIACAILSVKLYDLHYGLLRAEPLPSLGEYIQFMFNLCSGVQRLLIYEPRPPLRVNIGYLLRGTIVLGFALAAMRWVFAASRSGWPFFLEHIVKGVLWLAALYGTFEVIAALWRFRFPGRKVMTNLQMARTPAEFWSRYNRQVSQFFLEDIIEPLYHRIGVAGATMVAFFVSGLLHEYLVIMATGRVRPFVTTFFVLQGVGVVATYRWRPRGAMAALGVVMTAVFNAATALLYFAAVNQVFPWYSSGAPPWVWPR